MSANIEELVRKHSRAFSGDVRGLRNALTEQAEAFKGELQVYDGMVRELTKTVEDMQAAQPVPVVGEPVAWVSTIECIGPEYKKNLFGRLPIQSLQAGYYSHTALYEKPINSIPAAELATLREKAAMADEAHDVLRTLACELGAGGYNAEIVDASVFEHKIRDGVNMLLNPLMNRVSQAEQERDELRKDAEIAVSTRNIALNALQEIIDIDYQANLADAKLAATKAMKQSTAIAQGKGE